MYRLDARRQRYGVWDGQLRLLGIQYGFKGHTRLDTETHWDRRGSAKPVEALQVWVPGDLDLRTHWLECRRCGHEVTWGLSGEASVHVDPLLERDDHDGTARDLVDNLPLYEWMLTFENEEPDG